MACSVTEDFPFIDIQRGKEGTKNRKCHIKLGMTEACTKIMMEAKGGIGQRDKKGATKDCFIFDSNFSSTKSLESAMYVVADMIGMV